MFEEDIFTQEEQERGAHIARGWPSLEDVPQASPEVMRRIEEICKNMPTPVNPESNLEQDTSDSTNISLIERLKAILSG